MNRMQIMVVVAALGTSACVRNDVVVVRTLEASDVRPFCAASNGACTPEGAFTDLEDVRVKGTFRVGTSIPGGGRVVRKPSAGMTALGVTFIVLGVGLGALATMSGAGTFGNGPYGGNALAALTLGLAGLSFLIPGIAFAAAGTTGDAVLVSSVRYDESAK